MMSAPLTNHSQGRSYVEERGDTCLIEFWEILLGKNCECEKKYEVFYEIYLDSIQCNNEQYM